VAKRKFSAKQLANQRRFAAAARARAGKGRKARKSNPVARRTSSIRSRIASGYRRAKSSRIGQRIHGKDMAVGAITGAVASYSPAVLGAYGPGASMVAGGVIGNNETLQTMGAVALGAALTRQVSAGTPFAAPGDQLL
jgi:hypothetical protein